MTREELKALRPYGDSLPSGMWRHYKGGVYLVEDLARHSETGETMVVYVSFDKKPGLAKCVRSLIGPNGFLTPVVKCATCKLTRDEHMADHEGLSGHHFEATMPVQRFTFLGLLREDVA